MSALLTERVALLPSLAYVRFAKQIYICVLSVGEVVMCRVGKAIAYPPIKDFGGHISFCPPYPWDTKTIRGFNIVNVNRIYNKENLKLSYSLSALVP